MFMKHLAVLQAAGLGLALLSGPAFADWGPARQHLSETVQPAVAASAEATRLADGIGARPRTRENSIHTPEIGDEVLTTPAARAVPSRRKSRRAPGAFKENEGAGQPQSGEVQRWNFQNAWPAK